MRLDIPQFLEDLVVLVTAEFSRRGNKSPPAELMNSLARGWN